MRRLRQMLFLAALLLTGAGMPVAEACSLVPPPALHSPGWAADGTLMASGPEGRGVVDLENKTLRVLVPEGALLAPDARSAVFLQALPPMPDDRGLVATDSCGFSNPRRAIHEDLDAGTFRLLVDEPVVALVGHANGFLVLRPGEALAFSWEGLAEPVRLEAEALRDTRHPLQAVASSDGAWLGVELQGGLQLLERSEGRLVERARLSAGEGERLGAFTFSPDGERVAVAVEDEREGWRVDRVVVRNGSLIEPSYSIPGDSVAGMAWSARTLAVLSEGHAAAGATLSLIRPEAERDWARSTDRSWTDARAGGVAFSEDGGRLAIALEVEGGPYLAVWGPAAAEFDASLAVEQRDWEERRRLLEEQVPLPVREPASSPRLVPLAGAPILLVALVLVAALRLKRRDG